MILLSFLISILQQFLIPYGGQKDTYNLAFIKQENIGIIFDLEQLFINFRVIIGLVGGDL
jgi:hypothetical protein